MDINVAVEINVAVDINVAVEIKCCSGNKMLQWK